MSFRRTLVRESMIFLAAVVLVLSGTAFLVSARAIRTSLDDLFRNRLARAHVVLEQYVEGNRLRRAAELEALLTSPRLLAALETGDPATVTEEIPTHALLLEASLVRIADTSGRVLFLTEGLSERIAEAAARATAGVEGPFGVTARAVDENVYELLVADIVANNGSDLGRIAVARSLPTVYAEDLSRLTGFHVLLALDGRVVARSRDEGTGPDAALLASARPGEVVHVRADGEDFMVSHVEDGAVGLSVVFAGSLDETVSPIMERILGLLVALGVLGTALAMALAYSFMRRRVGRQVNRLVESAERIARGELDFAIEPGSSDELGYLAGEFEKMRSQLEANREQLLEAHRERLDAERMAALGQMATGIIHDFKNPMAVVQGTTDLIAARDPGDEKLARQCDVIHRQVGRMVALTRDVLEYANGRSVLEPETVAVADFLREIREGHEEACARSGVKLAVDASEDVRVLFDRGRMRRVVDNLVNNACEVSRVGDTVTMRWTSEDSGAVTLEIADQGPGIADDLVDRIFEPFVTQGKEGGSGLGLAIARKIVEDHGATLEVASRQGEGARFVIRLPARLRVADNAEEARTP